MEDNVRVFTETVLDLVARAKSRAPSLLPGVNGGGGFSSSGNDLVGQLEKATLEFASFYANANATKALIDIEGNKIKGLLMMSATLSLVAQEQADGLISQLQLLVDSWA
jgi:hypothetical protein